MYAKPTETDIKVIMNVFNGIGNRDELEELYDMLAEYFGFVYDHDKEKLTRRLNILKQSYNDRIDNALRATATRTTL